MRVAFISRTSLYDDKGGDTIQIVQTAAQLKNLGVGVDIFLANEKPEYSVYDLIHFFNIIRPDDILIHIARTDKPFVVSTIFVDYSEYEKNARHGASAFLFKFLSPDFIEYLKCIARSLKNGEKIKSAYYLFNGHKRAIQKIIKKAALLLPNSQNEYERLVFSYSISKKYRIIPNGMDKNLFNPRSSEAERDDRLVLCVARVEGRKNQLNLIRALVNTSYRLVIIGARSTNQKSYYEQCKRAAAPNIQFFDFLEQEALLDYYRKAKVHALPSWFETTGLSSLEAAAMGCNIVITRKGDAFEYFKDDAYYCNPESPESIFQAVEQAASQAIPTGLSNFVREHYTWENAAKKTLEAYKEIL